MGSQEGRHKEQGPRWQRGWHRHLGPEQGSQKDGTGGTVHARWPVVSEGPG